MYVFKNRLHSKHATFKDNRKCIKQQKGISYKKKPKRKIMIKKHIITNSTEMREDKRLDINLTNLKNSLQEK